MKNLMVEICHGISRQGQLSGLGEVHPVDRF